MSCAFKYILDMASIPNFIAIGVYEDRDGTTTPHAWNVVWFDGGWECCDLTTGSYVAHSNLYSREVLFTACLVEQGILLGDKGYIMDADGYRIEARYEAMLSEDANGGFADL